MALLNSGRRIVDKKVLWNYELSIDGSSLRATPRSSVESVTNLSTSRRAGIVNRVRD